MNFKILFFISLVIFGLFSSGCSSAKYYAPHMSALDKTEIKLVAEADVENGVYLNITPIYDYRINDDLSVGINRNSIRIYPYTKEDFKNYKNTYKDIWIIYEKKDTYSIPEYKVAQLKDRKAKWCRFYSSHNLYTCNVEYFLYNDSGYVVNDDVLLHAIAINKDFLNRESEVFKKWLLAGFDNFKHTKEWTSLGIEAQQAKQWIDLGIPSSLAKLYKYDEYIYSCYQYNLSLDEVRKWVELEIYNPAIINFLKFNGYTLDSFKYKSLQQLLNTMKLDNFFKMMDMQDLRVVNGYVYHWKYDTNYKRFFHILQKYYGIKE